MHFTQTGGKLTVDVPSWDAARNQAATVLKVTTTKKDRVLPTNGWTATGPTADGTNVPANAVDGDYTTLFRATSNHAAFLGVDMHAPRKIAGLRVVQPESSRIAGLNEGERTQSTRVKDYELSVSNDGQHWTPVSIGQLANQRGRQTVTFAPVDARYVRLGVKTTHNGATNRIEIVDVQAIAPGVSIPAIRDKVDDHQASNKLNEALAVTLRAHLDQAERQYDGRDLAAATRMLERFVWQLNKPSARHWISEDARMDLQRDADDLIGRWGT